ncbi:MAG: hypothetical protein ABIK85_08685 [Candidatus Eisenbacteria bacterium]
MLTSYRAFDAYGRRIANKDADGLVAVWDLDSIGAVRASSLYGTDEHEYQRLQVTRDIAGYITSSQEQYLTDPGTSFDVWTNLTTTVVRDAAARPVCIATPQRLEERLEYASDGMVAHRQRYAQGSVVPCSGQPSDRILDEYVYHAPTTHRVLVKQAFGEGGNAYGSLTTAITDWAGRPLTVTETRDDEVATLTYQYDVLGRLKHSGDVYGTGTLYERDAIGRLKQSQENQLRGASSTDDLVTQYEYDRDSNLAVLTDPASRRTTQQYDRLGQLTRKVIPNVSSDLQYDLFYDDLGRVEHVMAAQQTWDYYYATGRTLVTTATTPTGTTTYAYDPLNNLQLATRGDSGHTVVNQRSFDGRSRPLMDKVTIDGGASYATMLDYLEQGRLSDVQTYDIQGSLDQVHYELDYNGSRLTRIDGEVAEPNGGNPYTPYRMRLGYTGAQVTSHQLLFDAEGLGEPEPGPWLTTGAQLDDYGRTAKLEVLLGDAYSGVQLGAHLQWYGRDNRILGSVRGWTTPDKDFEWAQVRAAEYDGKSRLRGLRQNVAEGSPQYVDNVAAWLSTLSNREAMQDPSAQQPTQQLTDWMGGSWKEYTFSANGLGTLIGESDDDVYVWSATLAANGAAITSVTTQFPFTTRSLTWDSLGRLEEASPLDITWNGDSMPREITVQLGGQFPVTVVEERIYDAFGRPVRIIRDGAAIDQVYLGAEVVLEVTPCAERTWWPAGALDRPAAYTITWSTELACSPDLLDPAVLDEELALLGVTAPDAVGALLGNGSLTFAVVQDLHGDVVGLVDADGLVPGEEWSRAHIHLVLQSYPGRKRGECQSLLLDRHPPHGAGQPVSLRHGRGARHRHCPAG